MIQHVHVCLLSFHITSSTFSNSQRFSFKIDIGQTVRVFLRVSKARVAGVHVAGGGAGGGIGVQFEIVSWCLRCKVGTRDMLEDLLAFSSGFYKLFFHGV